MPSAADEFHVLAARDLADPRHWNACNLLRDAAIGMRREEQFVLVAAVECERQPVSVPGRAGNDSAYTTAPVLLSSQMWPRSVERPSLMSIMAEASFLSRRNLSDCEARLGIEVLGVRLWTQLLSVAQLVQSSDDEPSVPVT